jgi:hypothetical protein
MAKPASSGKKDKLKLLKVPTTVYLDPKHSEALRTLSGITHVPQQVYLRQGLLMILKENRRLLGHIEID